MDPSVAERELPVLDRDALESLFRRLHTLGQCADMRMDTRPFPGESQAEEPAGQRPPPHNWQYREELRRWVARRRGVIGDHQQQRVHHNPHLFLPSMAKRPQTLLPSLKVARKADKSFAVPSGSLESVVSSTNSSPRSFRTGMSCGTGPSWPPSPSSRELSALPTAFRRSNSERFRESAKAILRRMESFKVSSSSSAAAAASVKRAPLSGPVSISAPIDDDSRVAKRVARHLQCVDLSPTDGDENKVDACWTSTGKTTTRVFLTHNNNKKPSASAAHLLLDKRRLVRASSFTCGIVPSAADSSPSSAITPDREDEASFYENVAPVRGGRRVGINERRRQCDLLPPQVPPHSGSNWRTGITAGDATAVNVSIQSLASVSSASDLTSPVCPSFNAEEVEENCGGQHAPAARWHSFQQTDASSQHWNFPFLGPTSSAVATLSVGQMLVLRKVALFRLTALMEKHRTSLKNPSFIHWDLPKFIRRMKPPEYKDKRVFGVPLHVVLQRTGYPIPAAILAAMSFLRRDCVDAVGLFRKSGVRSRIEKLKHMCESEPEGDFSTAFDGQLVYDVGDMVKQYFRDLPEALLTNKLSETFLKIFLHLPVECREEAVNAAILLMPDENRESLFTLLTFLDEIAYNSAKNQMNAANLAVCFAPSLFHLAGGHSSRSGSPSPARSRGGSPKLGAKETGVVGQQTCGMVMSGMPDQRDLMEQRAAHQCLAFLISNCRKLFTVPLKLMSHCEFNYLEVSRPVGLDSLGLDVNGNWRTYMEACVTGLMKETKDGYSVSKYYRWVGLACGVPSVSVHFKKVGDGHPLRLWKISTQCDAPPVNIMIRILKERPLWDHHLLKWKTIVKLDTDAEVLQMVSATMEPHPLNEFLVLRFWRGQLTTAGGCAVVETSVEHDAAPPLPGTVRGVVLASRFLIEPCGSGRSRVTHISRLDLKGHSVEWYNKNYGHVAASALSRLRESFQSCAEGPETKV